MRDYRFRGMSISTGKWVYGSLLIYANGNCAIFGGEENPRYSTPVDPETVGQFTGLNDRNGKAIFEGDRLSGHHDGVVAVEWSIDSWICRFDESDVVPIGELTHWFGNVASVIGTIHDKEQPEG